MLSVLYNECEIDAKVITAYFSKSLIKSLESPIVFTEKNKLQSIS